MPLTQIQRDIMQSAVLDGIREGKSLTKSAMGAGTNRMTVYKWRQEDAHFAELYLDAWEQGTDLFEDTLYNNALVKEHPASVVYALRLRGRFNPLDTNSSPSDMDSPSTSVEALASKAIERGYVGSPKREST